MSQTNTQRWLAAVAAPLAALGCVAAYLVHLDGVERPSDAALTKTFRSHSATFEAVTCKAGITTTVPSELSRLGVDIMSCDYDGTVKLGFGGNRLGLAIGPGWTKGITRVTGEATRHGRLVASTDHADKLPADVYLRPIQKNWYIFYQRDDD
jgi:hypothetical protein